MDRISTATKAVDLFGAGKHGWKNANLGLGIAPTDFNAEWCNGVQEEMLGLVEAAGVVPSSVTLTQVAQALKRIFAGNITPANNGTTNLTADNAGLVICNAAAGNVIINLPAVTAVTAIGLQYIFYRTDNSANSVTINRNGANTIDGATSFTLPGQYSTRTVEGDAAANWATTSVTSTASTSKIQGVTASVAANAMTLQLAATSLDFRSSTLSVGTPNTRTTSGTLSLVIPSGATLGTVSGQQSRLIVLALDNAGTMELAVVNQAGGVDLDETGLITTTAISGAASSASVAYSTTARTSVPYRVVGAVESTQAAAGTWATAPAKVQGHGGQALASMQSLGYGQTIQNVTGSRAFGTTYYNTTGRPIFVTVNTGGVSGAASAILLSINGGTPFTFAQSQLPSGSAQACGSFIVGPGESYAVTNSGGNTLNAWTERR